VLQEGRGVWIANEELEDFSGKIIRLWEAQQTRLSLGQSGRDYAHEWSAAKQAARLVDFYLGVISSAEAVCDKPSA
jgi:hypothetical protein